MSHADCTRVVLIRHAQSQWNLENRFSGWADPELTEVGLLEAEAAGRLLDDRGFCFDNAYCSRLKRSLITLERIFKVMGHKPVPVEADWRLNERHYGALQGRFKTPEDHNTTPEQIWRWRRSYLDKAAPLALEDPRHPTQNPLYSDVDPARLPAVENLQETRARVTEFWRERVVPDITAGKRVFISSHGNTLRALLMELAAMSVEQVESFEIPTGIPIVVQLGSDGTFEDWAYLKPE